MLVDERATLRMRGNRWCLSRGFSHETDSCIHTLIYWCNSTLLAMYQASCQALEQNNATKTNKKSHAPFFPLNHFYVCFCLMLTFTQSLVFPIPSLLLFGKEVGNCFCNKFLVLGKAHQSLVIWRPPGVPDQPHSCSMMDKGPRQRVRLAVTLPSPNDRLYHVPRIFSYGTRRRGGSGPWQQSLVSLTLGDLESSDMS